MGQEEIDQRVLKDGSIEKSVRVRALCKVEWFEEDDTELVIPMSGVAISVRSKGKSIVTKVIGARLGSHWRRGFTLQPGIDLSQRSTVLRGEAINDVPTRYTIFGLEAHELPVIGTYIDPRIVTGFHYKVRPAGHKRRYMFGGRALRLLNIGQGYGKRITFLPDSLNNPNNYFWSDSYPDGVGFEPSAVRVGMKFGVYDGELKLGEAHVFRADSPQVELNQELEDGVKGKTVVKRIQVEVSCHVGLDVSGAGGKCLEPHDMRVSGTAVVAKTKGTTEAKIQRIENIGLDSQLNVLFFTQLKELVFYPL